LFGRGGTTGFDLLEHIGELVAEVHGNDRRRRFVGSQTVVIAGGRDGRGPEPETTP
jgi:hypothetical protein